MKKSAKAYRNIREAAQEIGVEMHVLRFWESKFESLKPMTRGGSRRFYSTKDMDLLQTLRQLLHVEGHTIKAVNRIFDSDGVANTVKKTLKSIEQLNEISNQPEIRNVEPKNASIQLLIDECDNLIQSAKKHIDTLKNILA